MPLPTKEIASIRRLLLCSNWFAPNVGGVETTSKILAEEFTRAGLEVTVVTHTPGPAMATPYAVVRQPGHATVRRLAAASDVVLQNLISLRTLIPCVLSRKPIVVTHQSWLRRTDGSLGPENIAKRAALRLCHNISISKAIADSLPVRSQIIGNPFETEEFSGLREAIKDRDLVFMGRLVSDKGCDLLLHALAALKHKQLTPSLTVIGDGPEMPTLKALTVELGLEQQVEFLGALRDGRGRVVARHRIMVIPSLWAEPFGVVALEGIASGCAIVASSEGGLPEAGGPCGLYFANRDTHALGQTLERLLTEPQLYAALVANGPEHLKNFQPEIIASRYLALFRELAA